MTKPVGTLSPILTARIAGFFYLLIFISAPSGAASATPGKMLVNLVSDTVVAIMFYYLFRPVGKMPSFVAALFRLIFVAVMAINSLNYFGAIAFAQDAHSATSFNSGYGMALIPFGIHCALTGWMIYKSTFLPRILGVLMLLAGFAYLIFLWPSLGDRLFFPYIVVPGVLGEGSLTLWLLVMGVDGRRWRGQSARAATRSPWCPVSDLYQCIRRFIASAESQEFECRHQSCCRLICRLDAHIPTRVAPPIFGCDPPGSAMTW